MTRIQYPEPLKQEEELRIIQKMQEKGSEESEEARNILVEHNIRLVIYIANRYKGERYELDDLVSIGTIGLIKAANTFELDKNIKFATYASRCIQNEILMHMRKTKKNQKEISIEETLTQDSEGNSLSILDIIGTERDEIEQEIQENDTLSIVKSLIDELNTEEKEILCYRFGIGVNKKKQTEIAELLDISQSYVSRIEKRALGKIKHMYEKKENLLYV